MIVISIHYMEGTSKKTGKPYQCHKVSGIERDYFNGGLRCKDYMVSPAEFERNPFSPGAKVEIMQSGAVLIQDTHAFDLSLLEATV